MITDAVPFERLPEAVQALGLKRLLRLSREGKAPAYGRLSAYGPALWSLGAILNWQAAKLAPLAPAHPSVLTPMFDGEPDDPRIEVTP